MCRRIWLPPTANHRQIDVRRWKNASPAAASHGVEADGCSFHIELAQELGHGGDLVAFPVDEQLAEAQPAAVGPGAHEVDAVVRVAVVEAVADGFAVDGDEAFGETLGIKRGEDAVESGYCFAVPAVDFQTETVIGDCWITDEDGNPDPGLACSPVPVCRDSIGMLAGRLEIH